MILCYLFFRSVLTSSRGMGEGFTEGGVLSQRWWPGFSIMNYVGGVCEDVKISVRNKTLLENEPKFLHKNY